MKRLLPPRAPGFTMIEVLVTILIVSFGLLALAAMLTRSIEYSRGSMMRTVALQQANDMADRMRANIPALNSGAYSNISHSASACTACTACTPQELATYDICTWNNQNANSLPLGRGAVTKSGSVYSVAVSWDGRRNGTVNESFTLRVDP